MALATTTIADGRHGVSSMKSEMSRLDDSCNTLLGILESNKDFQVFCNSTAIGAELNNKIVTLLKAMNVISTGINEITDRTTRFLNQQEELNNRTF